MRVLEKDMWIVNTKHLLGFPINLRMANIDPDYAFSKIQVALKNKEYIMTNKQLKLLNDRRTPAQIKYEKKGFKLKF